MFSTVKLARALSATAAALFVSSCGVTNTTGSGSAGNEDGPFYAGDEEIQLIVPFDAGGASDTFSRLLIKHFSKHIQGSPEIVVENIPSGAQKDGLNAFERADHNGFNMAMGSGGIITATHFDDEGIQFDLADYEPVIAYGGGIILFGSTEQGITSLEALADSTEAVHYGGLELSAAEAVRLFPLEQMGVDNLEPLMGYDGGEAVTAAVMRGELTVGYSTTGHYLQNVKPLEEQGDIVPLMVQGYVKDGEVVRDPAFPDVPTMPEAYETLTGRKATGTGWDAYKTITSAQTNLLRTYWVHGDAPADARTALNEAADRLAEDEAFLKAAAKLEGNEPRPVTGPELDEGLAAVRNLPQDEVNWVLDYLARWQ
jgi:tripartite-type tricarboxylate transporter receptor subunit TctC